MFVSNKFDIRENAVKRLAMTTVYKYIINDLNATIKQINSTVKT